MKCYQCNKELDKFDFLSLSKYREIEDEKILGKPFNFCSKGCVEAFSKSKENLRDFELYEINRCVGYYDCERLDNLRRMCEETKAIKKEVGLFSLPHIPMLRKCSPAEVGIIKSNLRLLDLFEKFDKTSTEITQEMLKHTKKMSRLTKWILCFTIANVIFITIQIILILGG